MTDVGVGSGALFGATQRWKTPENKSVVLGEITRRLVKSLGLQDSMTSELRDRKARLFDQSPAGWTFSSPRTPGPLGLAMTESRSKESHAWPNVKDEPRPRRA